MYLFILIVMSKGPTKINKNYKRKMALSARNPQKIFNCNRQVKMNKK